MAASPILNQTALVLAGVSSRTPADAVLRAFFAKNRRLNSDVRRQITRAFFSYYRWREWLDPRDPWQKKAADALALQDRFDAKAESIKIEALRARSVPAWLASEVELPAETLRQWQREPTLWLRSRPSQTNALAQALGEAEVVSPSMLARVGLRVNANEVTALRYAGNQDLFTTAGFQEGQFEIQDLASQLVGYACAPKSGETWWDACAGEGGKTLHLADLMGGKGSIWASDRSERRLETLKRRTARAKIFNYRTALWDGSAKLPTKTKFDGVLLDAPCSGVGTWQRNPHARWTTDLRDVQELAAVQTEMLNGIAPALKPGGRLVYAVCTLTRSETKAVADAFTAAHAEFEPVAVFPS
ncbi:MAG TPA: RsmB/NOP family class I SAM-dependent RNA methyltransferase, partial [Opitutaceae bacterium]